jgi:hypothetical protein
MGRTAPTDRSTPGNQAGLLQTTYDSGRQQQEGARRLVRRHEALQLFGEVRDEHDPINRALRLRCLQHGETPTVWMQVEVPCLRTTIAERSFGPQAGLVNAKGILLSFVGRNPDPLIGRSVKQFFAVS